MAARRWYPPGRVTSGRGVGGASPRARTTLLAARVRGKGVAVPWCETCSRFYNPSNVAPDGTCVTCGSFIGEPLTDDEDGGKIPWHFWVLVGALVLYLGWRLIEVVIWAVTGDWPT